MLGVDTPIGVAILRDLGRHKYYTICIGYSKSSIGFYSRFCNRQEVRKKSELDFIRQLLTLAAEFPGAALLAISESDHLIINRHRATLEKSLAVLSPKQEMLEQALGKADSIKCAKNVGIRVPRTFRAKTLEEVERNQNLMKFPVVLKWTDPNEVANDLSQAGLKLHKYQYAYNFQDLLDKLRPYIAISQLPLVQEYCPGQGIGQMFLMHKGEIVLEFQHQRIHEWPPEGGVSTLCKSIPLKHHQSCRQRSVELLRAMQWEGVAMVEYRYDSASNEYFFMEVNGRFWGSLPLAIAAGVPFATALVQTAGGSALNIEQPEYPSIQCRFMIPEVRRLVRLLFQSKSIQDPSYRYSKIKEFFDFFLYFFHPKMSYYLFTLSDPGPFFADIKNMTSKAILKRN